MNPLVKCKKGEGVGFVSSLGLVLQLLGWGSMGFPGAAVKKAKGDRPSGSTTLSR